MITCVVKDASSCHQRRRRSLINNIQNIQFNVTHQKMGLGRRRRALKNSIRSLFLSLSLFSLPSFVSCVRIYFLTLNAAAK